MICPGVLSAEQNIDRQAVAEFSKHVGAHGASVVVSVSPGYCPK
jgi:hypothetical protein